MLSVILAVGCFSSSLQAATVYEFTPSSRVITRVISGMSVDEIVRKLYPKEQKQWADIKSKLIEINPRSFYQNSDRLIPGSKLRLVNVNKIHQQDIVQKEKVGFVVSLKGRVSVKDRDGNIQGLQINSQVFEGDRVTTAVGAMLQIQMDDGAELFLKGDSIVKISEYQLTPEFENKSSSILDLIRGGLRKITGSIGSNALSNYKMQTGLVTIGIRGTEYVIKLCKQDDCSQTVGRNDPDAKLHAVVLDGIISLTNDEETQILMAIGEYGTASRESLEIEEGVPVPTGMLDDEESTRFNIVIPQEKKQKLEAAEKEDSGNGWLWGIGLLLLAL